MRARSNFIGKANFYTSGSVTDAECARPLSVLRDFDEISACARVTISVMEARLEYGEELLDILAASSDPVDINFVMPSLLRCQDAVRTIFSQYTVVRPQLDKLSRPHDEVLELVDRAIVLTSDLFDQLESFRWAILEHNADVEPKGEPQIVNTSEGLRKALAGL